jgi:hypothetical protein
MELLIRLSLTIQRRCLLNSNYCTGRRGFNLHYSQTVLKFKEETKEMSLTISFYGAEKWTHREIDENCLESFEM